MNDEISKEVKEAWQGAQDIRRACADAHVVRLADAFLHERAMRLKLEFLLEHYVNMDDICGACGGVVAAWDARHIWTDADWQAQAEAELGEK